MTASHAYPAAKPAFSLWARANPVAPPSSAVVAAVLMFGDICQGRDDGTTLIRFSPERIEREDIRLLLPGERLRALDVTVIWDDREEQLLHVIDSAALKPQALAPTGNSYADTRMRGYPRFDVASPATPASAAAA